MEIESPNKIGAVLGLPMEMVSRAEKVFSLLVGPAFREAGESLADQIRFFRFKNQIRILDRAEKFLRERNLNSKRLPLKVIAPLLENCSLEDDEEIQVKWAKLIANVLTIDNNVYFEQNCVSILSRISNIESKVLDKVVSNYHAEICERPFWIDSIKGDPREKERALSIVSISTFSLTKSMGIEKRNLLAYLSNLVSLGVIKWEVPDVEVDAEKNSDNPSEQDIDVNVSVTDSDKVKLTELGYGFWEVCNK